MKDNDFIDNKLYYYLKATYWSAPIFYGPPKIHKPGVPIHPMVSYSGSPLYDLLKAQVIDENNNAKNSATFSKYIRNVPIEDDEIMVYTKIPITDMLNISIMLIMMMNLLRKWLYLKISWSS